MLDDDLLKKLHEKQAILETKGVGIGSNFNYRNIVLWILLVFTIVVGGIGIWKLWQKEAKKNT
jgi:hypothetical protein